MEAGNPLPSLWRQGHTVFRPGASNTRHYTKDARAAVEGDGGRWHCSANVVSASAAESGIPSDEMGTISMSCARRPPKMGGSSPDTEVELGTHSPRGVAAFGSLSVVRHGHGAPWRNERLRARWNQPLARWFRHIREREEQVFLVLALVIRVLTGWSSALSSSRPSISACTRHRSEIPANSRPPVPVDWPKKARRATTAEARSADPLRRYCGKTWTSTPDDALLS
jgi:hypothetical protein